MKNWEEKNVLSPTHSGTDGEKTETIRPFAPSWAYFPLSLSAFWEEGLSPGPAVASIRSTTLKELRQTAWANWLLSVRSNYG